MKLLITFIFLLLLTGCKKFVVEKIVGTYQLDKTIKLKEVNYKFDPILTLNADNTFSLNKDIEVKGSWRFKEYQGKDAVIQFNFNDKIIIGKIETNIINFEYPNDFDQGSFKHMKYVKLRN